MDLQRLPHSGGADPDIPIMKQAKAEYANLKFSSSTGLIQMLWGSRLDSRLPLAGGAYLARFSFARGSSTGGRHRRAPIINLPLGFFFGDAVSFLDLAG
jgi:hypothetical protein